MKIRRGDVYWASFSAGRRRPVLVLTRDVAIALLNSVTVAPATRTIRGIATEVRLSKADGMPEECALSFDNLQSIPKAALRARITTIRSSRLEEICDALGYALGC